MNLQSDLTRNRAVFEALTGVSDTADSAELRSVREARVVPVRERAESAPRKLHLSMEATPEPSVQSFSLSNGVVRETGMSLSFKAPDDVEYPALQGTVSKPLSEPMEILYHQLDVEARMSSQLSQEEEF